VSTDLIYIHPAGPDEHLLNKPVAELTADEWKTVKLLAMQDIHHKRRRGELPHNRMVGDAEYRGEWYCGRAFLSCIMAGHKIPKEITADCFRMPWNKIIFEALLSIQNINAGDFQKYDILVALLSQNPHFDHSFRKYLEEIFNMIGAAGNVNYYAQQLLILRAGMGV
jgi:hypothetical protein